MRASPAKYNLAIPACRLQVGDPSLTTCGAVGRRNSRANARVMVENEQDAHKNYNRDNRCSRSRRRNRRPKRSNYC